MSFLHLFYLGYFEHDGAFVRFCNTPDDPILKPIVRLPLDLDEVRRIARQAGAQGTAPSIFPDNWKIWVEEGYLSGDRYALDPEAMGFILRLVKATGCEIVDFSSRSLIPLEDLLPANAPGVEPMKGVVHNGPSGTVSADSIIPESETTHATP